MSAGEDDKIIDAEIIEESENTDLTIRKVKDDSMRFKLRRWVLKTALAFAIIGPLIFLLAALGYRLGMLDLSTSLGTMTMTMGPVVLFTGLIISLFSVLMSWFMQPKKGLLLSLIALLIPLGGLIKGYSIYSTGQSLPAIHDITTDSQDPPMFTKAILDLRGETSNPTNYFENRDKRENKLVSILQAENYPEIRPVLLSENTDVVFGVVKDRVRRKGWNVVTEDADAGIVEATVTSFWYGFKDDVILRIRPSKNGGSIVDMRSTSRVGQSDLGDNAERLNALIKELQATD